MLLVMKWIGITGSIACGKTSVANILKGQAVPIVDADKIAHQALKAEQQKIVQYFGSDILGEDGRIHRGKLGQRVFANPKLRQTLESIVHPFVKSKVAEKKRLLESAGHNWAVYDVPLLFENKMMDEFDKILVVYASEQLRFERLMERNNLNEEDAKKRMEAQISLEKKKDMADDVIENEGDLEELKKKVLIWKEAVDEEYGKPL